MNEGHSAAWDQDWRKAAAAYRQALQEFPDEPKALNSLGLALFQLGDFEDALQTYKRVAAVSKDDAVAFGKGRSDLRTCRRPPHCRRRRHARC